MSYERSLPMAMLPNDSHPGPGCSCEACMRAHPDAVTAFRVELMFDRGKAYETVEAKDADEAVTKALKTNKGAYGARIWRKPMSIADREHYGDVNEQKAEAASYTATGHAAEVD